MALESLSMRPGEVARSLCIATHRSFLCVRWAELNISLGKVEDYGEYAGEVVEAVAVSGGEKGNIYYEVTDGKIVSVCLGYASRYVEDHTNPKEDELALFQVVEPEKYAKLAEEATLYPVMFNMPHSCRIDYIIREEKCSGAGCNKIGPVNYHFGDWKYYCGGGPRCCP